MMVYHRMAKNECIVLRDLAIKVTLHVVTYPKLCIFISNSKLKYWKLQFITRVYYKNLFCSNLFLNFKRVFLVISDSYCHCHLIYSLKLKILDVVCAKIGYSMRHKWYTSEVSKDEHKFFETKIFATIHFKFLHL